MDKQAIQEIVSQARNDTKKRNFTQSIDVSIGLRDINLKDPSKRFKADILMPHNVNDNVKICVIGDADVIHRAEEAGIQYTLNQAQVEEMVKNANETKAFISEINYFLAIPQMMAAVGKFLGRFLGPAGKMPTILPPNADIAQFTGQYSRTVRIRLRTNPVINCKIGTETLSDEQITDNLERFLTEIEKNLDNGFNQVKSAYLKWTMGPSKKLPRL